MKTEAKSSMPCLKGSYSRARLGVPLMVMLGCSAAKIVTHDSSVGTFWALPLLHMTVVAMWTVRRPGVGKSRELTYATRDTRSSRVSWSRAITVTSLRSALEATSVPVAWASAGGTSSHSLHRCRQESTSGDSVRPRSTDSPVK
uniref:Uncharacterized protein n=1 Tax=Ixodes ricinus TaxID=34613 RepID=A0A6B0UVB5_IXORI